MSDPAVLVPLYLARNTTFVRGWDGIGYWRPVVVGGIGVILPWSHESIASAPADFSGDLVEPELRGVVGNGRTGSLEPDRTLPAGFRSLERQGVAGAAATGGTTHEDAVIY